MGMGRVENGKIVNHSGVARVRLNDQELAAVIEALTIWIDYLRRQERTGDYCKGLLRLKRKLVRNRKRLPSSKVFSLVDKHVLFVKSNEKFY
jgi:hypothetical protein